MTRDEYLLNHDANEGAESYPGVTRCPVCGSEECSVIYTRNGEAIGCDRCVREVSKWECKSNG